MIDTTESRFHRHATLLNDEAKLEAWPGSPSSLPATGTFHTEFVAMLFTDALPKKYWVPSVVVTFHDSDEDPTEPTFSTRVPSSIFNRHCAVFPGPVAPATPAPPVTLQIGFGG